MPAIAPGRSPPRIRRRRRPQRRDPPPCPGDDSQLEQHPQAAAPRPRASADGRPAPRRTRAQPVAVEPAVCRGGLAQRAVDGPQDGPRGPLGVPPAERQLDLRRAPGQVQEARAPTGRRPARATRAAAGRSGPRARSRPASVGSRASPRPVGQRHAAAPPDGLGRGQGRLVGAAAPAAIATLPAAEALAAPPRCSTSARRRSASAQITSTDSPLEASAATAATPERPRRSTIERRPPASDGAPRGRRLGADLELGREPLEHHSSAPGSSSPALGVVARRGRARPAPPAARPRRSSGSARGSRETSTGGRSAASASDPLTPNATPRALPVAPSRLKRAWRSPSPIGRTSRTPARRGRAGARAGSPCRTGRAGRAARRRRARARRARRPRRSPRPEAPAPSPSASRACAANASRNAGIRSASISRPAAARWPPKRARCSEHASQPAEQVEARDAAPRAAAPPVGVDRDQDDRPAGALDHPRGDDPDDARRASPPRRSPSPGRRPARRAARAGPPRRPGGPRARSPGARGWRGRARPRSPRPGRRRRSASARPRRRRGKGARRR